MPYLHYGPEMRLKLDAANTKRAIEAIGAHATRGGWVSLVDTDGREWSVLVSPGVPIWVSADE
jgi:hypothetical protein